VQCLNKLDTRGSAERQEFKQDDERRAASFAALVAVALRRAQGEEVPSSLLDRVASAVSGKRGPVAKGEKKKKKEAGPRSSGTNEFAKLIKEEGASDHYLPIWATATQKDEDVFGFSTILASEVDDLRVTKSATLVLRSFLALFDAPTAPTPMQVDMKPLVKKIGELITFVTTGTENPDPLTREGLPICTLQRESNLHLIPRDQPAGHQEIDTSHLVADHRQIILREQEVLDLAMECIQAPWATWHFVTPSLHSSPRTIC
jgi:hypothetical protein